MALIESGAGATNLTVDPVLKAARVSPRPMEGEHYRLGVASGLITTVAAATASAGHLFAFRWGSSAENAYVNRIHAVWKTVVGFTAAQEIGMDCIRATGYSASHSGGTGVTLTAPNLKKRASFGVSLLTDARYPTTGALTAGTHTFDAQPLMADSAWELAAAATVPKQAMEMDIRFEPEFGGPLVLTQNEGFVIRNSILMGAGGTARLFVMVDWTEGPTGTDW